MIDVSDIPPAELLAALYNAARPRGLGHLLYDPKPMKPEEAEQFLGEPTAYIDYLHGRVLKVWINGRTLDPILYDRDNGLGAAQRVVDALRSPGGKETVPW